MADNPDMVFDPSKKKKKKKKIVSLEDDAPSEPASDAPSTSAAMETPATSDTLAAADLDDDLDFDKKKKKKPKKVTLELEEPSVEAPAAPAEVVDDLADELDVNLEVLTKKKKKKPVTKEALLEESGEGVNGNAGSTTGEGGLSGASGDYTYDELLKRVFDTIREKNPEMITGEKKRVVMKPPQLMRVGSKKTAFVNLAEIAKHLKRQLKHVLQYLLAELGTTGSIDGNSQIILRGRFQSKHIEPLLRNYVKEFVMCHTCRSQDTDLVKDTRLFFLDCKTCGSRCSVTSIKSGFQALTGRRAQMRAKTS